MRYIIQFDLSPIGSSLRCSFVIIYPWFFHRNNEVQFAGEIQARGCCYHLQVPSGDPKVVSIRVK